MAPTEKGKKPAAAGQKKNRRRHNNRDLGNGVTRWSRSVQYKRKGLYRLKSSKPKKVERPKVAITVVKKIGGAKNGGERVVLLRKSKANYSTRAGVRPHATRNFFKKHPRYTRKSLTPGRVLILLAGRHQGKRVVLLKVSWVFTFSFFFLVRLSYLLFWLVIVWVKKPPEGPEQAILYVNHEPILCDLQLASFQIHENTFTDLKLIVSNQPIVYFHFRSSSLASCWSMDPSVWTPAHCVAFHSVMWLPPAPRSTLRA